jgi:hypothetical protein
VRIARCTRCGSFLVDLASTDPARPGVELHDVGVVNHEQARLALLEREPLALATVASQLRRRHLEELVAAMPLRERGALERIEQGAVETNEMFRGLITRALAVASELPPFGDVRPRTYGLRRPAAGVGLRTPLELGDGSRAVLEPGREGLLLLRMRGDAVVWRAELSTRAREAFVARVTGRAGPDLVVLTNHAGGAASGDLFLVDGATGVVRGRGDHGLRAAVFEAHALPEGCTFVASYQAFAVVRADASVAWQGSSAGFPVAVPVGSAAVVIDAPWRLVALELPLGRERWSVPVDRGAAIAPSAEGHLLFTTSDVVARLDVRGDCPRLAWMASGSNALALAGGGAAVVRERWERGGRSIECLVIDANGRKRFGIPRPEATKMPVAEIGSGVLLYHSGGDVAVSVETRIAYALALPEGRQAFVTVEDQGAWIEYDGVVDRIDGMGKRVGRWRVG